MADLTQPGGRLESVRMPSASEVPSDQIHQLVKTGDIRGVYSILNRLNAADSAQEDRYRLLNDLDENGEPASLCAARAAARAGCADILDLLALLPTIRPMIDANSDVWHIAAANGHAKVMHSLLCSFPLVNADLNRPDEKGNTPLCLAVLLGHDDVAELLVTAIMSSYHINSASTSMPSSQLIADADGRSILYYAARFSTDPNAIKKLISATEAEKLEAKDKQGDSFLHVAAKAGSLQVLQALKELGPTHDIAIRQLLSSTGRDHPLHSPALLALFYNQRAFFEELVRMGEIKITLGSIPQRLIAELIFDFPEIQDRLGLFALTLPTYLALFAKKDCVFNFLLETKLLSISQWDHKYKRTCLQWAVLHDRKDIVEKLMMHDRKDIVEKLMMLSKNVDLQPGWEDKDEKTAMQHAFDQKKCEMMRILVANPDFKNHGEKLQGDREVYVQGLNAILVGAALIASVTFVECS